MKFVTFITKNYIPGFQVLLQSMRENSGFVDDEIEFVVLKHRGENFDTSQFPKEINIKFIDLESLGTVDIDKSLLENPKFAPHLNKILVFNLPYDEEICWVDADMLCLGDITKIKEFTHFTAAPDIGERKVPYSVNGFLMFNTGFFVFRPSKDLFSKMQEFAKSYGEGDILLGDQGVINDYLYNFSPEDVKLLNINWNVVLDLKKSSPATYKELQKDDIKFLHFIQAKPWMIFTKDIKRLVFNLKRMLYWRKEYSLWRRYHRRSKR